jgi:methyltransferase family protein
MLASPPEQLPDLDLNVGGQLELLEALTTYQDEVRFPRTPDPAWRYHHQNDFFPHADAVALYSMIRHLRPGRLVEVGAGFSSAVTLDTNERFLDNAIECVFIDPRPNRLQSLLREGELERLTVLAVPVQDVPMSVFESLRTGDILFIDSSHVSKMGSDVNHILFELLPRLAGGVHVHFHDVQYPFEYPVSWAERGRAWSEAYLLRAFLQSNSNFQIVLFNDYLKRFHPEAVERTVPTLLEGGGSIWLERSPA